jgi:phage FluMu protein Com
MTSLDPYAELVSVPEQSRKTRSKVRCANCSKLLAELVTSPWLIRCPRCKADNQSSHPVEGWSVAATE